MKFLQVKVPDELHWQFKKKCFEDKVDMSERVREWMKKCIMGE